MKRLALVVVLLLSLAPSAFAQDPPPRIGPFVVDARLPFPMWPDTQLLADSRGLNVIQLPGMGPGLGGDVGVHVYLFRWKAVTFGIGGEAIFSRGTFPGSDPAATTKYAAVTEEFRSIAPQISFNFGSGKGWSYISGGIGRSKWSIVPEGQVASAADEEPLQTINYGGGGRWWPKPHLGVNLEVRFWAIDPGSPHFGYPGGPRTLLVVMSGGLSIK